MRTTGVMQVARCSTFDVQMLNPRSLTKYYARDRTTPPSSCIAITAYNSPLLRRQGPKVRSPKIRGGKAEICSSVAL